MSRRKPCSARRSGARRTTLLLVAALVLCACLLPARAGAVVAPGGILWGTTTGDTSSGSYAPGATARAFGAMTRKSPSILHFYYPFASCTGGSCRGLGFPRKYSTAVRRTGAIPMLTWMTNASNDASYDSWFSPTAIARGTWDSIIRSFAIGAKRWGHPFFLRFDPEMNGNWEPWSGDAYGNRPQEYAAMWRHVYDVFQSVGATNATWVWCPNVTYTRDLRAEYPGNQYVDWTCLDGYNWGTDPDPANQVHRWLSFNQIFHASYRNLLRIAPSKPVMIGEFASTSWGGSKAGWLRNALAQIPRYSHLRAAVYFDLPDSGMDWPLHESAAAEQAFASGVSKPVYRSGNFRNLGGGTITS